MKIIDWLLGWRCEACGQRGRTNEYVDRSQGASRLICSRCHDKAEEEQKRKEEQRRKEEERKRREVEEKARAKKERKKKEDEKKASPGGAEKNPSRIPGEGPVSPHPEVEQQAQPTIAVGGSSVLQATLSDAQTAVLEKLKNATEYCAVFYRVLDEVTDQSVLATLAKSLDNRFYVDEVVKRISDPTLLKDVASGSNYDVTCKFALDKINDQKFLTEIAKSHPNHQVRSYAIQKVTDTGLRAALVAADSGNQKVRLEQLKKATNATQFYDLLLTAALETKLFPYSGKPAAAKND